MHHTMTKSSLLLVGAVALMLGGCGDKYGQSENDSGSPQFARVASMLAELRSSDSGGIDEALTRQSAADLNQSQAASLRATLTMLAQAEQTELTGLDRFGKDIYRASIQVTNNRSRRSVYILLVDDGDDLRWAGMN